MSPHVHPTFLRKYNVPGPRYTSYPTVPYWDHSPTSDEWLRELKNHVINSYHIELEDLDYTPFDEKGGRGKMYQLFGAEMNNIINELNEVLAA